MIEHGRHLHLLRNGELVDAVLTTVPPGPGDGDEGCAMELSYRGRKLRAYGIDPLDAMHALRGALEVDGLLLNVPRPRRL